MSRESQNFYRIDDVLIWVGVVGGLLVLAVGGLGGLYLAGTAEDQTLPPNHAKLQMLRMLPAYLALLACPVVALKVGFSIRGKERRISAIWSLLKRNAQISVPDLLNNSDFTIDDVERTVKLLNTRGLGHYVWDRREETVQDGRLRTTQIHVEKCEVCGGSVSLEVPIGFTEVPSCPYCGDPVSVDALEGRRQEALDALRAEHAPEKPPWRMFAVPFSVPIFLLLLFSFWPLALGYAWWKHQSTGSDALIE